MKSNLLLIFILSLVLLTGCNNMDEGQENLIINSNSNDVLTNNEIEKMGEGLQESINLSDLHKDIIFPIPDDLNKDLNKIYFLKISDEGFELIMRNLEDSQEQVMRQIDYDKDILKIAISSNESKIAFIGKEEDKLIVYVTGVEGGELEKIHEYELIQYGHEGDYYERTAQDMILKRVGLEESFFYCTMRSFEGAGSVWDPSIKERGIILACSHLIEVLPDNQILEISYHSESDVSLIKKPGFFSDNSEEHEGKSIMEIPLNIHQIENIELIDEKTLHIMTKGQTMEIKL